jgi:hypothetical protein
LPRGERQHPARRGTGPAAGSAPVEPALARLGLAPRSCACSPRKTAGAAPPLPNAERTSPGTCCRRRAPARASQSSVSTACRRLEEDGPDMPARPLHQGAQPLAIRAAPAARRRPLSRSRASGNSRTTPWPAPAGGQRARQAGGAHADWPHPSSMECARYRDQPRRSRALCAALLRRRPSFRSSDRMMPRRARWRTMPRPESRWRDLGPGRRGDVGLADSWRRPRAVLDRTTARGRRRRRDAGCIAGRAPRGSRRTRRCRRRLLDDWIPAHRQPSCAVSTGVPSSDDRRVHVAGPARRGPPRGRREPAVLS